MPTAYSKRHGLFGDQTRAGPSANFWKLVIMPWVT